MPYIHDIILASRVGVEATQRQDFVTGIFEKNAKTHLGTGRVTQYLSRIYHLSQ
jgi:hypothetical protein